MADICSEDCVSPPANSTLPSELLRHTFNFLYFSLLSEHLHSKEVKLNNRYNREIMSRPLPPHPRAWFQEVLILVCKSWGEAAEEVLWKVIALRRGERGEGSCGGDLEQDLTAMVKTFERKEWLRDYVARLIIVGVQIGPRTDLKLRVSRTQAKPPISRQETQNLLNHLSDLFQHLSLSPSLRTIALHSLPHLCIFHPSIYSSLQHLRTLQLGSIPLDAQSQSPPIDHPIDVEKVFGTWVPSSKKLEKLIVVYGYVGETVVNFWGMRAPRVLSTFGESGKRKSFEGNFESLHLSPSISANAPLTSLRLHLSWINCSDLTSLFSPSVTPSLIDLSLIDCYLFSKTNLSNPDKAEIMRLEDSTSLQSYPTIPREFLEPFKVICPRLRSFELYQDESYGGPFWFLLPIEEFDWKGTRRLAYFDGELRTRLFEEILACCFEEKVEGQPEEGLWNNDNWQRNKGMVRKMERVGKLKSRLENLSISFPISLQYILDMLRYLSSIRNLRIGPDVYDEISSYWNEFINAIEKEEKATPEKDRVKKVRTLEKVRVMSSSTQAEWEETERRMRERGVDFLWESRYNQWSQNKHWDEWF